MRARLYPFPPVFIQYNVYRVDKLFTVSLSVSDGAAQLMTEVVLGLVDVFF